MQNKKNFSKINIIDALIVLVIIIGAIAVSFRFNNSKSKELSQVQKFQYVVRIDNIRQCTVDGLNKMGDVFSYSNDIKTGTITDVRQEPYKEEMATANGTLKSAVVPERYSCFVTVDVEGQSSDNSYYDNDKVEIAIGRGHVLCSKLVKTSGEIISVTPVTK